MEQALGFFDLVFTQAGVMPNKPILAPINFGEGGKIGLCYLGMSDITS